jgi:hypothetical protein
MPALSNNVMGLTLLIDEVSARCSGNMWQIYREHLASGGAREDWRATVQAVSAFEVCFWHYGIASQTAWFNFPHRLADFGRDEMIG